MNNQKPEPRSKGDGSTLDVHSIFFTIQGEGPFAGHRSIFVRLAGCNLQCPGCDTEYTQGRKIHPIEELTETVVGLARDNKAEGCLVVITGGEPLRQAIGRFVSRLTDLGHIVQIESNGVFEPDEQLRGQLYFSPSVHLVISPKTTRIHPSSANLAACFKYVLDHRSVDPVDGLPIKALEHPASTGVARPRRGAKVYLNPYDVKDEHENALNLKAVAESCLRYGHIMGIQLHKVIGYD